MFCFSYHTHLTTSSTVELLLATIRIPASRPFKSQTALPLLHPTQPQSARPAPPPMRLLPKRPPAPNSPPPHPFPQSRTRFNAHLSSPLTAPAHSRLPATAIQPGRGKDLQGQHGRGSSRAASAIATRIHGPREWPAASAMAGRASMSGLVDVRGSWMCLVELNRWRASACGWRRTCGWRHTCGRSRAMPARESYPKASVRSVLLVVSGSGRCWMALSSRDQGWGSALQAVR